MQHEHPIHIFINKKEYEIHDPVQTGASLKNLAGIPLNDVLFLQRPGEDEVIPNDTKITLKNGEHLHSQPPADYGWGAALLADAGIPAERAVLHPEAGGWQFIVISDFDLPRGFEPNRVELLVKLPPGFPDAAPDMFWVHPAVRTVAGGVPRSTSNERLLGKNWQRFSWHLAAGLGNQASVNSGIFFGAFIPVFCGWIEVTMNLRVIESQWNSFIDGLRARSDVETAGIILAERLHGGEMLLARHMVEIPPEGYLIRRGDQLRLDPITLNRIIRPARDGGLSVITVHTHPGTTHPWFSDADDRGDAKLMPSLFNQMAGPHGSAIIAGETGSAIGRIWSDTGEKMELGLRIVGRGLRIFPSKNLLREDLDWFDRQRIALGQAGQEALRRLHVAIVGMGGTGSVAFLQLAHLGIGRITVIDGDRVEASNVSRILGATARDAGRTWKVDVAARYAEHLGIETKMRCLRGHFGKDVSPAEIEGCDLALSCVDRHLPRALLNRLSYEKAVPLIDMGSAFRVDEDGRIAAGAGRVVVVGPGRPCLACWGHIDGCRIRIESLSEADHAREMADGYISGAQVPQPSVVAFNTAIAGAAVVELMRLVTGFAGTEDPPLRLSFDFSTGTVRRNSLSQQCRCRICLPKSTLRNTLIDSPNDSSDEPDLLADEVTI